MVTDQVECLYGGQSVPIEISVDALPFDDITVSLESVDLIVVGDEAFDPSAGIVLGEDSSVTLSKDNPRNFLTFTCDEAFAGYELAYSLAGTNADSFSISEETLTVGGREESTALEEYTVTLTVDDD